MRLLPDAELALGGLLDDLRLWLRWMLLLVGWIHVHCQTDLSLLLASPASCTFFAAFALCARFGCQKQIYVQITFEWI
jgi:hypothetical protein